MYILLFFSFLCMRITKPTLKELIEKYKQIVTRKVVKQNRKAPHMQMRNSNKAYADNGFFKLLIRRKKYTQLIVN